MILNLCLKPLSIYGFKDKFNYSGWNVSHIVF